MVIIIIMDLIYKFNAISLFVELVFFSKFFKLLYKHSIHPNDITLYKKKNRLLLIVILKFYLFSKKLNDIILLIVQNFFYIN